MEFKKSDGKVISIKLGIFDLLVAVKIDEADEVEEIEIVVAGSNVDTLGEGLMALVGTGLGSPIL